MKVLLVDDHPDIRRLLAITLGNDFELLQAQVAVANERPGLIRARNDYRVAAESLLAVLGTSPQRCMKLTKGRATSTW